MTTTLYKRGFVFPRVMGIGISGKSLELPKDAYILYIQTKFSAKEKKLMEKWQNGYTLADCEYKFLIENSLRNENFFISQNSNREQQDPENSVLSIYGLRAKRSQSSVEFEFIEDALSRVKASVYDSLLINILRPLYSDILKSLYPDHKIYLGPEISEVDRRLQSLNTSLRVALFFTQIAFLYGNNFDDYESFESFFHVEFEKRARLVKNIWVTSSSNQPIKYIPIFDSFRNYKKDDASFIINVIKKLLISDEIVITDKDELENQLIKQAKSIRNELDTDSTEIKEKILEPIVSHTVNISKAEKLLHTAQGNFKNNDFDSSINRCYYSMMRAVRALLAHCGVLGSWREDTLNPKETHISLEKKLKEELIENKGLMDSGDLADFKYVKEQRMLADYNELYLDPHTNNECLHKAKKFIEKTKQVVYG